VHFSIFKANARIQRGTTVRVIGLPKAQAELNGSVGKCSEWDQSRGGWVIQFQTGGQPPAAIPPKNLEMAEQGAPDEFLGWCQIASKKFTPDGYDGSLELNHAGSAGALLRVHINSVPVGSTDLPEEIVPMHHGGSPTNSKGQEQPRHRPITAAVPHSMSSMPDGSPHGNFDDSNAGGSAYQGLPASSSMVLDHGRPPSNSRLPQTQPGMAQGSQSSMHGSYPMNQGQPGSHQAPMYDRGSNFSTERLS